MLTRNEAIEQYVGEMNGIELMELVRNLCGWDGSFDDCEWFDMCDFDEICNAYSPSELASMMFYGRFNPNDDYFTFDGYGNLTSGDCDEMARDIGYSVPDIIEYLQDEQEGHTGDGTLDDIIDSDSYSGFNDHYELI